MARRRVVTGLDAAGRSIIVADGTTSGRFATGEWEELWAFAQLPASLTDPRDPVAGERFRLVPETGIACRLFVIRHEPDAAADREWEQRIHYAEFERPPDPDDLGMHRTPTVDVIVVVSGEMDLVLDSGQVAHLGPGDAVIQRGTMHAWRATGPEPCLAVAVMVRAE